MSQYNKTVLTRAGLELAKRANAGQAKFGITRAVTSADDWSNKTVQDLEEVTIIPNIMQQGTIMDTDEVESNNSVIGVSLCFTNKNLSTGYQIRIIGLYVREEGQENDFLYAVTTAITPESMPSFADKVLYKFNMQMYLVIGKAQAVNVVINEGTAVTSTQFNKYKGEVADNLKKLENTHKEDMSHVAKSASINGGAEILPDSTGKLNLVVPDPDLSKYVSLEQLGELLKTKADAVDVDSKIKTVTDLANTKANSSDLTALDKKAVKSVGIYPNDLNFTNGQFTNWSNEVKASPDGNGYALIDLTDDTSARAAVDQLNAMLTGLNHLQGKQTKDSADANALSETGVYYCSSPAKNFPVSQWGTLVTSNGNGARASQLYFPDDNSAVWFRTFDGNWRDWVRLANIDDVNNAKSSLTSSINANVTQLQNSKLNFKYITDGYDLLSADGFWGVMEANNTQNLKNLPNGMNNKMWMYVLKLVKDGFGVVVIFDQDNHIWVNTKNGYIWTGWMSYARQSDVTALQNIINQQNQTIQSLTSRLNNAENEINYIKSNYIEGRRFAKSQEAQANSWENENPQRIAFITDK
ncbi:pyocin knob domain-containing protein [Lactobacillus amylovorus]|uniref:pyocin knob domain-containing protein n=1 Tax=Lactobacillus amylovorus TaxID=1604 RepID=UPI00313D39F8|nr:pyocin knob domain-containing protein [Lactobacillus amylovorus]